MDAVDEYVPTPERDVDKPFLMPIEDVFSITGRGTVVTGRVERGRVKLQDEVEIVGMRDEIRKTVVTGVEMFRKILEEGLAGDNIGVLLRGIDKDEVERGQVLAKPGSIKPHTKIKPEVYVLTKEEWRRHTPFFNGYRAPVLLPHHRRYRHHHPAGRCGDGHAWGQYQHGDRTHYPIAIEERPALCHPGRTDRRELFPI